MLERPQTRHHAGVAHGESQAVAAIAGALVVVAGDRLPVEA